MKSIIFGVCIFVVIRYAFWLAGVDLDMRGQEAVKAFLASVGIGTISAIYHRMMS